MLKLRAILAAGFLALSTGYALAAAAVWNPVPVQIRTATGTVAAGAKAYFFAAGTTTPYTVYSDNALTTPHAHPVIANSQGVFPTVYVPYTLTGYRVQVKTSADVAISDIDGIANPDPPVLGGGAGIVVATEQVFQPGWTVYLLQTGTVGGFVRMNGRTIGSAASGATERANADTSALYSYIWTNCADAQCAVASGRGATAAADFAANKTITLPDMRGRAPFGLADMGNSTSTRLDGTTFGSGNKTTPVSSGGTDTRTLTTAELPSHTHTLSSSSLTTTLTNATNVATNSGTAGTAGATGALANASPSTIAGSTVLNTLTLNNTGSGSAYSTMNPFMLGGWYMKL